MKCFFKIAAVSAVSAVFGVGVLAAGAAHAQSCPSRAEPYISVQVVDPGPTISSTKTLKQINAMAGSHGLLKDGFRVLGMTQIDVESGIQVDYEGQPRGSIICVRVAKVQATFGLKRHYVHVPREYPRGSCQFNVVMRHEMAHVDVNRRTVRKYAQILKNEVRSAVRKSGVVAARSMAEGQGVQQNRLQAVIEKISEDFNAELERLHGEIDAPHSKYAARDQCRGW